METILDAHANCEKSDGRRARGPRDYFGPAFLNLRCEYATTPRATLKYLNNTCLFSLHLLGCGHRGHPVALDPMALYCWRGSVRAVVLGPVRYLRGAPVWARRQLIKEARTGSNESVATAMTNWKKPITILNQVLFSKSLSTSMGKPLSALGIAPPGNRVRGFVRRVEKLACARLDQCLYPVVSRKPVLHVQCHCLIGEFV